MIVICHCNHKITSSNILFCVEVQDQNASLVSPQCKEPNTTPAHSYAPNGSPAEAPACPVEGDKRSMSVGNQGNYAISNNMNCHQVCCHVNVYLCPAALPSIYSVSL